MSTLSLDSRSVQARRGARHAAATAAVRTRMLSFSFPGTVASRAPAHLGVTPHLLQRRRVRCRLCARSRYLAVDCPQPRDLRTNMGSRRVTRLPPLAEV